MPIGSNFPILDSNPKETKYESIEGKNWKNENIKVGMSNIKILNVRIICNNLLKVIIIIMKI